MENVALQQKGKDFRFSGDDDGDEKTILKIPAVMEKQPF
jgi:hypothetical protein